MFSVVIEESYNCKAKDGCCPSNESLVLTLDCDVSLVSLLNADPVFKWFPETKLAKAKQYYGLAVELFKQARYLDSFYLFQPAYRLTILGEWNPIHCNDYHLTLSL